MIMAFVFLKQVHLRFPYWFTKSILTSFGVPPFYVSKTSSDRGVIRWRPISGKVNLLIADSPIEWTDNRLRCGVTLRRKVGDAERE